MAATSKSATRSGFREREYSKTSVWAGRIVVFVLLIGAWELLSGRAFNAFWLSKPSLIAGRIVEMLGDGDLWYHMSATLQEAIAGLAIGMVGGTLLGIGLAFSGIFERWIYPYMMALYSLPRVSLAPLFIVWFGIGLSSKILMVTAMVIFVAFYNAFEGMRNIDKDLMDMMSTYKAKWSHKLRWVVLPSITVWILTSIRLNIGMALIGSVIAELVGSNRGLGYYITYSSNMLDTTGIFTGLVLIMLIAVVLEQCVLLLERVLLRHR
ncbi:NitT/TauT family transport system permease protein [Cohnella sp. OV330]|uniref:ABC transporter permease n=1 Tax=Cohnella sp. OV330 TaxID=1855288 RepID=UPI0008E6F665|nr:ABC transporter permease [Cohnella sp. OV330]SFA78133.1 NitT/TauT family transport system permease protein [Cohnella sp. OV330]